MSAEGGLTTTGYIQHHLTNLTVCSDAARDAAGLAAWCRARLAGYKLPVDFIASEALPRNASGKLLRRELARRAPGQGGSA